MNKFKFNKSRQYAGFTIIEVVLVLAIAGLIFLMVFVALPALQRSQRDNQRKQDLSRAISAMTQYQANNRGQVKGPNSGWNTEFRESYLEAGGSTFRDPDGGGYFFVNGTDFTSGDMKDEYGSTYIRVYWNSACDGENVISRPGQNNLVMTMHLESGGIHCLNN